MATQGEGEYLPLNILWRVQTSTYDLMSSVNVTEKRMFTDFGAYSYVPATQPLAGPDSIFWRLYENVGYLDHMDSTVEGQDGYTTEGPLGYVWTSSTATPGLSQLCSAYDVTTLDHATCDVHEILPGYTQTPEGAYGYHRENLLDQDIVSTTAGGITIGSNTVSGCAVWSWIWNGKEFLNQADFGRLMQSSVNFINDGSNPTEAGDQYSTQNILPDEKHGSPCARMDVVNSPTTEFPWASASTPIQATRSVPLEWYPWNWGGGDDNPVIWKDMLIGKNITLNYNNMGAVAKYTTVVWVPNATSSMGVEIPTAYMTGDFTRQYLYDTNPTPPQVPTLVDIHSGVQGNTGGYGVIPISGYGGVIFATDPSAGDGDYAMGVYGVSTPKGGSILSPGGGFSLYQFASSDGNAPTASNCWKWAAHWGGSFAGGGYITFNVYITTGTLADVQTMMKRLFAAGVQ